MGNYKFKFSDMIPNVWFYKLRDMSLNSSSHNQRYHFHSSFVHHRKSHYIQQHFPPRHTPSVTYDHFLPTNDIVFDVTGDVPQLLLPPIKTKPSNNVNTELQRPRRQTEAKNVVASSNANADRKKPNVATSSGVRLRVNSPKIGGRRVLTGRGGKTVRSPVSGGNSMFSDSFVVVKTSMDPYGDFKRSMMEMIVENEIRDKKDLEELLACYLSLNSDEYHDVIIKVFKHIWIHLFCLRSK